MGNRLPEETNYVRVRRRSPKQKKSLTWRLGGSHKFEIFTIRISKLKSRSADLAFFIEPHSDPEHLRAWLEMRNPTNSAFVNAVAILVANCQNRRADFAYALVCGFV